MKIQIKSVFGKVLFECDAESVAKALIEAVKASADLRSADLRSANLYGANLSGANLYGANLRSANLSGANLSSADLRSADLRSANLSGANLYGADLYSAKLSGADLRSANLYGANLSGANLYGADLSGANLRSANLSGANLRSANLSGANLYGADLRSAKNSELAQAKTIICPEGSLIGWKKCLRGVIVKLEIPVEAKRSCDTGRKCRAEFVKVLEVQGSSKFGVSIYDSKTEYRVGQIVRPNEWCSNRWEECAGGIHFYITREEALAHQ